MFQKGKRMLHCSSSELHKWENFQTTKQTESQNAEVNHDQKSPVAKHFTLTILSDASVSCAGYEHGQLPQRWRDINTLLLKCEPRWIYTPDIMSLRGLNEETEILPFSWHP